MATNNANTGIYDDDEITLRELILKVREYFQETLRNWKIIFVIVIISLAYMSYRYISSDYAYRAELTFMINQNEASGTLGLGSILGQFGMGGRGEFNRNRIIGLSTSRRIIEKAIFEKAFINGKEDFLANHLIINLDTQNLWTPSPFYKRSLPKDNPMSGFRFMHSGISEFDSLENAVLIRLYEIMAGNARKGIMGMMSNGFNKESGILHISVTTDNPELSVSLTNSLFDNLSQFYIDNTIEQQKTTYDVVKAKSDSLYYLLQSAEAGAAAFEDQSVGTWGSSSRLPGLRLNSEIQKLSILYGESLKNLEIADFALKNQTPFVQAIDRPILPLEGIKTSLLKSIILAVLIGILLSSIFIMGRKIYRDSMLESKILLKNSYV